MISLLLLAGLGVARGSDAELGAARGPDNVLTEEEKREGYELLFNGKNLLGWDGDPELWSVQDGLIVASTEGQNLVQNSFLITKERFSDFIFSADVKLRNNNTGIQFRSRRLPEFIIMGYQADAARDKWWGSLYGEKTGRGVIVDGWAGKGEKLVKRADWNRYEIYCKGDHIKLTLNGVVTADVNDDMASEGVIALQVHRGSPMQVSFRNVKIKKLK